MRVRLRGAMWLISDHKRDGGAIWPLWRPASGGRRSRVRRIRRAGLDEGLVDVGERAPAGDRAAISLVAVAGDLEREVAALALGQRGERAERFEGLERVVERSRVGDDVVPVAARRREALEVRVAALDRREAVGLVDGDDAQPGEDRVAVGLACAAGSSRRSGRRLR